VRIGVVGAGAMGSLHVRLLASDVVGAELVAVADVELERAAALAREVGLDGVHGDGLELIAEPDVEAVVVASSPETHEVLVLACLDAGKPVLCEKPLATSAEAGRRIVEAEAAGGRRLVDVGFMRRYDDGYRDLKRRLDDGEIGAPLVVHCVHRNADIPPSFDQRLALTDSVVHEVDVARWLLGEEIAAVTVVAGRPTRNAPSGVRDPQVVLLETAGGVLVDVESFLRAQYGYDVRCEVPGGDRDACAPAAGGDPHGVRGPLRSGLSRRASSVGGRGAGRHARRSGRLGRLRRQRGHRGMRARGADGAAHGGSPRLTQRPGDPEDPRLYG
jgi:myo-inositol 2-dehydrogenase/D-chiro-inositol 1-dehydrogenase